MQADESLQYLLVRADVDADTDAIDDRLDQARYLRAGPVKGAHILDS